MIQTEIDKCIEYGFDSGKDPDNEFLGFGMFLLKDDKIEINCTRYFLFRFKDRIQDNKFKFSKTVKSFKEVEEFIKFCNGLFK